jgi:hypothetical protein
MILIYRISEQDFLIYNEQLKDILSKNLANRFIKTITIILDSNEIKLFNHQKLQKIYNKDISNKAIIDKIRKKSSSNTFILSNPFVIFNDEISRIQELNLERLTLINPGKFIAFGKKTPTLEFKKIDELVIGQKKLIDFGGTSNKEWNMDTLLQPRESEDVTIRTSNTPKPNVIINSRPKRLDVVIVSVDYNDYLQITLEHNTKIFQNITVVTSETDWKCQEICNHFKVRCIKTNVMWSDGAKFNKAKSTNIGIKSIENPDFILCLDADIIVKNPIDLQTIEEHTLYTSDRKILETFEDYQRWILNRRYNTRTESNRGLGFFQLFNVSNSESKNEGVYYNENFKEANGSDLEFRNRFKKRLKINNEVIHIGPAYKNWKGRTTPTFISKFETINNQTGEQTGNKNSFTICSYYFNFRNDSRMKENFKVFIKQFENFWDKMIVGIVDYGDIDFEMPCEKIIIKGDSNKKLWSKEILINKIVEKIDTEYIIFIDGDLIYENLDWLNNIQEVVGDNDFIQLFENINYLGPNGEIQERHKSIASTGRNDIDQLMRRGYKPGGSWLAKVSILKEKKMFEKMYVGGGDTIFIYGLFGIKNGWTLDKVKESNIDIYKDAINWIGKFDRYKLGYLPITISHLYHGDLKDRNYNGRYGNLSTDSITSLEKIDINSNLPEFGYELISILPYAYNLFEKNMLGETISGLDTSCLYFFNSHRHKEKSEKRGWHNMKKLWDIKFPNIGIHQCELDWSKFSPPPLKEHYESKKIVFKKETVVICNRYNMEWNDNPINFLNLQTLSTLFEELKHDYQIVYINLKGDERYYDNAPPLELGDFELIRDKYKNDVIIIQDLIKDYNMTFNEIQLCIFAGCSKFITSNGGQSILASYFGGENIIFTKKCREIQPEVNSFYRWYYRFGGSVIKVVNSEEELIDIVISKWVKKEPLINIIIRTSSRPNYFNDCIDSIYKQNYKNWNIIVGTDDTESRKYIQPHKCLSIYYNMQDIKIENPPNNIEYGIKFKYNLYFNEMHKYVNRGYIMYLDDDDMLYKEDSLSILAREIVNNQNDLVFFRVKFPNRLVPNDENFKKKIPIMKDVSGIGYIFDHKIKLDWEPYKRGDYRIATKLTKISKNTLWLDEIITSLQRKTEDGFGRKDDKTKSL